MQRSWRETCREATLICTNYTPVRRWRGGGTDSGKYMGVCARNADDL